MSEKNESLTLADLEAVYAKYTTSVVVANEEHRTHPFVQELISQKSIFRPNDRVSSKILMALVGDRVYYLELETGTGWSLPAAVIDAAYRKELFGR